MNNIPKKYLPVGSIVLLKDATKKLFIIGFCHADENDNNKIYDYLGCMYPEGMISLNHIYKFNHEDINELITVGYVNDQEVKFKKNLENMATVLVKDGKLALTEEDAQEILKEVGVKDE